MRLAFVAGVVAGFIGLLCGAHFYPWQSLWSARLSPVVPSGQADHLVEQFVIRLPADRIATAGTDSVGLRGVSFPEGFALPPAFAKQPVLLEHFKLRDLTGNVVGIAARHWVETADGSVVAWLLLLPGRGVLMLSGPGETREAVDAALTAAGYANGRSWTGDLKLKMSSGEASIVEAGTGVFAGFDGGYVEDWELTSAGQKGYFTGTITLAAAARQ